MLDGLGPFAGAANVHGAWYSSVLDPATTTGESPKPELGHVRTLRGFRQPASTPQQREVQIVGSQWVASG